MKRWILMCAVLLATVAPAFAQIQGGSISGSVKDEQGGVLPGTTVTVKGVDATLTTTSNAVGQYRFLELAPGPYKVTVELPSFATVVRDVIVVVGRSVDLPVTLKLSSRGETIDVTAASPIVDPKVTGTAVNFTSNELQNIPTSRDPFALMRTVPGVLLDQVNIAGNETGQQPNVLGKGSRQQDTTWAIDGVEITDMGALG
jgi:Carboxypeptidase regulatory-like domain